MFQIIRSDTRGAANHGWLDAKHTFSFADYHDPERMGFGSLRVINEDRIAAGGGFDTHPHRNMEIVTYIITGALEHKDSMGNGSTIQPGELQRMTAGRGVFHSEFNSSDEETHLLQIWIHPEQTGLEPGYEQKLFEREGKLNRWQLLGSRDGLDGSLTIHQDISLSSTILESDNVLDYDFAEGRRGFLQVVSGKVSFDDDVFAAGDGVAMTDIGSISVTALEESELLLFDMA
jgi:redox-sensitive bicupin YhaK (pirin superfamily)